MVMVVVSMVMLMSIVSFIRMEKFLLLRGMMMVVVVKIFRIVDQREKFVHRLARNRLDRTARVRSLHLHRSVRRRPPREDVARLSLAVCIVRRHVDANRDRRRPPSSLGSVPLPSWTDEEWDSILVLWWSPREKERSSRGSARFVLWPPSRRWFEPSWSPVYHHDDNCRRYRNRTAPTPVPPEWFLLSKFSSNQWIRFLASVGSAYEFVQISLGGHGGPFDHRSTRRIVLVLRLLPLCFSLQVRRISRAREKRPSVSFSPTGFESDEDDEWCRWRCFLCLCSLFFVDLPMFFRTDRRVKLALMWRLTLSRRRSIHVNQRSNGPSTSSWFNIRQREREREKEKITRQREITGVEVMTRWRNETKWAKAEK